MLFLVVFVFCISLFFEMTICSGGAQEIVCREIMFQIAENRYYPIGYLDGANKKYIPFDQKYNNSNDFKFFDDEDLSTLVNDRSAYLINSKSIIKIFQSLDNIDLIPGFAFQILSANQDFELFLKLNNSPFDQKNKVYDIFDQEIDYIRETPTDGARGIIRKETNFLCLSDDKILAQIACFLRHTSLDSDSKKIISQILDNAQNFQYLLHCDYQIDLSQFTINLASNFITTICDPEKQKESHVIRNALRIFLDKFKVCCDNYYEKTKEIICSDENKKKRDEEKKIYEIKKERYLSLGLCIFLIIGLYNEYKNQTNRIVQRNFAKIVFFMVACEIYVLYDLPVNLLRTLEISEELMNLDISKTKYISEYNKILQNPFLLQNSNPEELD